MVKELGSRLVGPVHGDKVMLHPDAPCGALPWQSSNMQTAVIEGLEIYLAGKAIFDVIRHFNY